MREDRLISEKQVLDAICHDKCGLSPNRCISGITGECVQIKPIKAIPSAEPSDVLDKIRSEIKALSPEPTAYDVVDGNPIKDVVWETLYEVLQIIDKYKTESEDKE